MAYRTRLRSARLAHPPVEPPAQEDPEPEPTPENSSELTGLGSSTGSAYPSAVSFQADNSPTDEAITSGPLIGRDAHLLSSGGTVVEEKSHDKNLGADEHRGSEPKQAVESDPVLFSNSVIAESTPAWNHQRQAEETSGRNLTLNEPELMAEQGRTVEIARLSMTDEERERFDRRTDHVQQVQFNENKFHERKFSQSSNDSSPEKT